MEFLSKLFDLLFRGLGDDAKWRSMIDYLGTTNLYIVLFAIVFAETGLVVTPFLPGDSLLFALGALGARDVGINLPFVTVLLIVAAIVGDAVNYWIGYKLGPAVFNRDEAAGGKRTVLDRMLNRKHLLRAQAFYDTYGGKTIILARFVPVVRTFAPFVAGVGRMNFFRFWVFNIVGAVLWVGICVSAGWFFGGLEFVKKHFELVILAIIVISVLPMVFEFWKARRDSKKAGFDVLEATTIGEPVPPNTAAPARGAEQAG